MTSVPPPGPKAIKVGPYTLVDRLAVGGMAEVFRATEPRPAGEPRMVVIKRMLPNIAAERGSKEMFKAEADLGAVVRHRNVVEVISFGDETGQPYLALEYVPGLDLWRLTRWLTRTGTKLGVDLSVYVVRELLAGLHAVHEAVGGDGVNLGLVHRDVSPSNVLLSVEGDVKLGDFGIAQASMRSAVRAPLTAGAKGKLGYLAPEAVNGETCDRRADVFSAGVIAAELLMGRPLFSGGSELAVLLAIRDSKIHPFEELRDELPDGLVDLVKDALKRAPDERLGSASELWARLGPFCTEPVDELKEDLADLVQSAAETLDNMTQEATPLVEDAPARTPLATDATPTTADAPNIDYVIRTADGRQIGPWPYSKVVEALAVGTLGPDDEIIEGAGAERKRILSFPALRRHLPPSTSTGDIQNLDEPAKTIALADGGVTIALAQSMIERATGLWLCEAGGVRKELYIKDGFPEFVTSNLASELLGEHLVSKRVISRGELDMALAVMPRFEGKLGDTLAALGLVEPVHLFQHIATSVQEKLLDLFLWKSGKAMLYVGVPPPESGFPLGIDPWQIIEEGIRRRIEEGLETLRFDGREDDCICQSPVGADLESAQIPADARLVLNATKKPCTLAELTEALAPASGDDPYRGYRAIVLLLQLQAIRWA